MRPLVDIHPCVQARRLFELDLTLARRALAIQFDGVGREEAVGVEMRAADVGGLDDVVRRGLAQAQRQLLVALLTRRELVDHRPLVHPEAPQVRGAIERRGEQRPDERDGAVACVDELVDVKDIGIPFGRRDAAGEPVVGDGRATALVDEQRDACARVPAPQLAGGVGVVDEEEILDGMLAVLLTTSEMRFDVRGHACLVGGDRLAPLRRRHHRDLLPHPSILELDPRRCDPPPAADTPRQLAGNNEIGWAHAYREVHDG